MEKLDYQELGFKSGLEIHQQLDSHKLFCNCPSLLRKDEPDFEIKRKLHAVAGESGKVDEAADYEAGLGKEIIYQGFDTTCLVELDEEPPHLINQEALKIALQISLLLNAKILPISQIMRKTVINGSNTSGFQRTVMIARDGFVETSQGRVGIEAIFLEEDAARTVSKMKDKAVFRIDRLGIPLVEIMTRPDIKSAEQAKETALKIGEILRACKVKRGIGTIRQDINISIKDGNRVELKGFQDPKIMIETIDNEIKRQLSFAEKENPSEVRNVLQDGTSEFLRPMPGAARMYVETDVPNVRIKPFLKGLGKVELISDKTKNLEEKGISADLARELVKNKIDINDYKYKDLNFVARVLIEMPKEIDSRLNLDSKKLKKSDFDEVLKKYFRNEISKEAVFEILVEKVKGNKVNYSKYKVVSGDDLEKEIKEIIKKHKGVPINALMGIVMGKYRGKVDGKKVMEILKKNV